MKKKRKGTGSKKGSAFEREVCKRLSLWFSNNERDDVFWRTAGSGARATSRGKKRTFGQYGDVQATDPIGQPLIDAFTIELKKGYNKLSIQDLIDVEPKEDRKHPLEKIIDKIEFDAVRAESKSWMLIWKRDRRVCLVILPYSKVTKSIINMYKIDESTALVKVYDCAKYFVVPFDTLIEADPETFMEKMQCH